MWDTTQASITGTSLLTEHLMKPTMRVVRQSLRKQSILFRKVHRDKFAVHFTRDDLISLLPWIVAILIAMLLGTWLGLSFPGNIISD